MRLQHARRWVAFTLMLAVLGMVGCESDDGGLEEDSDDGVDSDGADSRDGSSDGSSDGGGDGGSRHVDLGALADGGQVQTITVEVPQDANAFTLVLDNGAAGSYPLLDRLTGPDGATLFAYDAFNSPQGVVSPMVGSEGELIIHYPLSPSWPWQAGVYELEVVTVDAHDALLTGLSYDANLLFDVERDLSAGELDLIFWFTQGEYFDAAGAEADAAFQEGAELVRRVFAGVGITVGEIAYRDMEGAAGTGFAVISSEAQKRELFRSAPSDRNALSVFFIDEIVDDEGGGFITLGEASGIPSAPSHPSLTAGSVIISGLALADSPQRLGETVAHEVGHALGLFHTTEQDGAFFDPIDDTPECGLANDLDGDTSVLAEECRAAGADNLMFWTAPEDEAETQESLTSGQGFVLHRMVTVE